MTVRVVADCSKSGLARTIEEHAGGDHGRGVQQRGDGRRAFHRVGQPDVQRELRRLADDGEEEEQRDGGRHAAARAARPSRSCPSPMKSTSRPNEQPHVGELGDPEGLHRGARGARLAEVEADEEVARDADELPAREELEEVRRDTSTFMLKRKSAWYVK